MRRVVFTTTLAISVAWPALAGAQTPSAPQQGRQQPFPPLPQQFPQQQQPYYPQQQQPYPYPPPQQPQPYYPQQPQPYYPQQQQPYPPPQYQPPPPYQPPYQPPPDPPPPEKERHPGWEIDSESWGLRGTSLSVSGGDHETSTLGLGLGSVGLANGQGRVFSYRVETLSHIGGGSGGFEGALTGSLTLGAGWLADGAHGPFIRGGFQGQLQGNDSFFLSGIRFPRGEVGWHIGSSKGFVLEVGGTAAPMLDGRFNVGDVARRRLGSSSGYGAYADVFIGPLAGTIEWVHTNAVSQPRTAVNDVVGHICLGTGTTNKESGKKDWGFGLCLDGRHTTGDVGFGAPFQTTSANTTYFGLTIGLGTSVSKSP